jgi:electron transfer flavoprotein alpha subunit
MAEMFAYILHKNGEVDDTALELVAAARRIDPAARPTAIVAGSGPELEAVCARAAELYPAVWKVEDAALSYPNAEVIRKVLVRLLPKGAIVLVPHEHFGMDLAPGLSIKLGAAFVPDVVAVEALEGGTLKLVRQEFGGQVSTHVSCDVGEGAVITLRPGAFAPEEAGQAAPGQVVDKSGEAGDLTTRRRFLEVTVAETGDVDIS